MKSYYRRQCSCAGGKSLHDLRDASSTTSRKQKTPVTHSMVYTIRLTTTNTHLKNTSGHPTHCIDCAVQLLRDDLGGDYIGLLKAGDSVSYAAACEEGKPHQLLLKDGYCVVSPPSSLDTDWTTFVDSVLMPRFEMCAKKGLSLLANYLNKKSI